MDKVYKNEDIIDIIIDGNIQPSDGFMIGSTTSQTLDLTLLNKGDIVYGTSTIKVEIGLKIGSTVEYIPLGIYNIDDIEKTDYTIKITAYDNMMKFERNFTTTLGDTLTLQQVASELTRITGVQFTGNLPAYTVKKLEGFSCREILGYVASLCGGNAVITRDGNFTIITPKDNSYSIGTSNYFDYKREETKYKIGKISCQAGEEVLSKGSLGADSMELEFENPWVTNSILQDIYNKLNGFEYLGYSMKWQGDPSVDVGDIVTITDKKGVVRKHPILSQKLTYTGGLTSEISAKGENKNKNEFSSSGSTTNRVNRLVTEQAVIKEALIGKANITDLIATNAEITNLKVKNIEIENALINVAHIEDLNVINANIQNLIAADANIINLVGTKANIADLTAKNIKFNVGTGGTLDLQTLLSKFVSGENGQYLNLTSSNVVIDNAVIKDIIAKNISVEDLKASTISTNKFRIASDNGGIEIVGATQQFKDKNNKVRIQMGQDTQGNFNFILRGEDGTTTLIDHTGIKEKAIADDLIKEKMIAENAIGEKQINYSSLVTGLNKDTNTQLIKASKVAVDLTGQSLEVSFNSLKSNLDSKESRNYIRNGNSVANDYFTYLAIEEVEGKRCFYQTHKGSGERYIMTTRYLEDLAGKTVTLSFLAKQTSNLNQSEVFILSRKKGSIKDFDYAPFKTYRYTEKLTQYKWTYTFPGDIDSFYIRWDNNGSSDGVDARLWITDIKLEIGENLNPVYSIAPEDLDSKIKANTTSIEVVQGSIATLISDTTIERNGTTTKLKDAYSTLEQTVSGINSTVASHTSSISSVQATADSKAKVFISTPTTPYKVGDIWTGGPSGELMKCKVSRASGSYVAADWEKASKYTDDTKANAVEGSLNTLSGKVTTVENNYISLSQDLSGFKTTVSNTYGTKAELSNLSGTVSSITSRVSTAESSITQLNNKITQKVEATEVNTIVNNVVENLQVGGRNLWIKSKTTGYSAIESLGSNHITGQTECYRLNNGAALSFNIEPEFSSRLYRKVTFSAWVKYDNVVQGVNSWNRFNIFKHILVRKNSSSGVTSSQDYPTLAGFIGTSDWKFVSYTYDYSSNINYDMIKTSLRFNLESAASGTAWVTGIKVEIGDKATDYSDAPEDVDEAITTVDGRVTTLNTSLTTTNNKVATIETSLNSITSRVSSTESSITTINGNVSSLQSRISTAENKITSDAIVSTVRSSTAYTTDLNAKANQSALNTTNSNVSGLTTRINTVEQSITATAITTTISSAINAGTSSITTTQFVMDKTGFTVKNGAIKIQNKAGTNVMTSDTNGNLTITGTFVNKNSNGTDAIKIDNTNIYFYDWERNGRELGIIYSSYLSDYPNCRGFSLAHNNEGYLTWGYRRPDGTFGSYAIFDKYSKNPSYTSAIRFTEGAVFSQAVNLQDRVYVPQAIYFDSANNPGSPKLYKGSGKNILAMDVSVSNAGEGFGVWSNTGTALFTIIAGRAYTISQSSTQVSGNFSATGTKARLVNTKNYGGVKLNAVESADAVFEDIGEGKIDNTGICYIYIDSIMQEAINTKCSYQVFLQKYNEGDLFVLERTENYFIVKGNPNLKFGWRFIAKQKGYETERLEQEKIIIQEEFHSNIEHEKEINYDELASDYLNNYEMELMNIG